MASNLHFSKADIKSKMRGGNIAFAGKTRGSWYHLKKLSKPIGLIGLMYHKAACLSREKCANEKIFLGA